MWNRLQAWLKQEERPRIVVVGDIILDEYLRGSVGRISPEAPVPVLDSTAGEQTLGGAANVAHNLAALGCRVALSGVVGDDAQGQTVLSLLQARGIEAAGVVVAAGRPTTHKLRVVAQGQQVVRIDREERAPLAASLATELAARVEAAVGEGAAAVICSDYKKGLLSAPLLRRIMTAAAAQQARVAVDPKGSDYKPYSGAWVLTPNLREMQLATGMAVDTDVARDRAARRLLAITRAPWLLVTCGPEGMILYNGGSAEAAEAPFATRIAAQARAVYDVTGAGDTVIATLTMALCAGASMPEAAVLANVAAGIVVGKPGTATVQRRELLHDVVHRQNQVSKVVAVWEAKDRVARAKARGQRVVFTNGCFDLLHAGHVQYLQAAKRLGDLLVVGLNDDASVRALKGPERPIMNEWARAQVLAGLAAVDLVVLFPEATPAQLIAALVPDILVKGADYQLDQVVGRDVVEAAGGRVELVPVLQEHSTTNIVSTILQKYRCA